MKKVTLNISERIYLLGILNQFKGSHSTLALVLQDIVPVGIGQEEKDAINLQDVKDDAGNVVSIQWDSATAADKEIEFHEEVVKWALDFIEKKSEAGEFTIADRPITTLVTKLNQ